MRKCFWGTLAIALVLASCGGGGDGQSSDRGSALASAPLAKAPGSDCLASSSGAALVNGECLKVFEGMKPQRAAAQPLRSAPVLTPDALFDWAQGEFWEYFSGPYLEGDAGPYHYRYYFDHDNYLAVGTDGIVYILGAFTGWEVKPVAALADFTCSVFSCTGGGGGGGNIDWNSAFSAEEILQDGSTLAPHARKGWSFDVTGGTLPVETIFASQFPASFYVMSVNDLSACVNGDAFNYFPDFSFNGNMGFKSFDLPAGSYGVCLVNNSNASNGTRVELQNRLTVEGFHFQQASFTPIVQAVQNGGRLTQPVSVGDSFRVIVDGGNSGGEFFIIPASEQQNFLNGNGFQYYTDMTGACGQSDRASPGLCELTGVGEYAIAYRNNTGSSQSIVVVGRDYVPD